MANIIGETYHANSNITSANVPCGATRILEGAFHGCFYLETANIASSVATIGEYAFLRCTSLVQITNFATVPQPIDSTTFFGVDLSKVTLRVPTDSIAAYQSAPIWREFIIVAIPEGVTEPTTDEGICIPTCTNCDNADCEGECREPIVCDPACTGICTPCDYCERLICNGECQNCSVCGERDCNTCTTNIRNTAETEHTPSLQTWITNNVLHIKGLTIGETYRIFTLSGMQVCQGIATMDIVKTQCIEALPSGTYIIQSENKSAKFVW
jgi:hypothetical protein